MRNKTELIDKDNKVRLEIKLKRQIKLKKRDEK